MKLLVAGILVFVFVLIIAEDDIDVKFNITEVVSDVLKKAPKNLLQVNFDGHFIKEFGQELTPTQVKSVPSLTWDADPNAFYTVFMIDPDSPRRDDPKTREFLHWLVMNVPGIDVGRGDTIAAYVGSGPWKGTNFHRYVLLVYKQPHGKLNVTSERRIPNNKQDGRYRFSVQKFAEKHYFNEPIAGNMYIAQWDDYVLYLHRQLSTMQSFNV